MSSELPSTINKERAVLVLIPLLILNLALLSVQIEGPSGTLLFKTWTLALQAPILAVSSGATKTVRHAWHNYVWMVGARAENEQLHQSLNRLMMMKNTYEQTQRENLRLRRLLALTEALSLQSIGARVIARTPNYLSNIVYIDRGAEDGVPVDAAVISGDGIVGRVILVTKRQAQVQLITNPDASVGVILERTRTPGVLRGTGDSLLEMVYVANTEQVEVGESVLSSGLDGIYPKGILIGKVVDSRKGKGVFRSIKVEPRMDMIRLEEVSVLLNVAETGVEASAQ
ncbi:MAG: rod shape-determining protein MreC [Acidobacteriota bacterium]|nr:rod shape-determining protein MreC [Acidobacteriota bacterium]